MFENVEQLSFGVWQRACRCFIGERSVCRVSEDIAKVWLAASVVDAF